MAEKKKKKEKDEKKQDFVKQLRIAYRNLEDPKKFYRSVLAPCIFVGLLMFSSMLFE